MVLERIQKEDDIKKLKESELDTLAEEIRQFLVEKISKTGGHLASNLGVVELTMADALAFSRSEKIKLYGMWDIRHIHIRF